MNWRRYTGLVVMSIYVSSLWAQENTEDILWSSIAFNKKISAEWSAQVKPTIRYNNDLRDYQNTSIDLSVKRNLGKGWSAQFLTRIWFIPDGRDRLFLWGDLAYKFKIPSLQLSVNQRLRYHQALDTRTRLELDYFRYIAALSPATDWKIKPIIFYERWFILNDVERYRLSRLSPGFSWTVDQRVSLSGALWRQLERSPDETTFYQNLWVVTLGYKL